LAVNAASYVTHKYPTVKAELKRHKRFPLHVTPASSSWLNLVERFFRDITLYLREGSFCRLLQIAPSGYRRHVAQQRNPELCCCRARRDDALSLEVQRVGDPSSSGLVTSTANVRSRP